MDKRVRGAVLEQDIEMFIVKNISDYIDGQVSDKYFIGFLQIIVNKDYMRFIPRFSVLIPKLKQLLAHLQSSTFDKENIKELSRLRQMVESKVHVR